MGGEKSTPSCPHPGHNTHTARAAHPPRPAPTTAPTTTHYTQVGQKEGATTNAQGCLLRPLTTATHTTPPTPTLERKMITSFGPTEVVPWYYLGGQGSISCKLEK